MKKVLLVLSIAVLTGLACNQAGQSQSAPAGQAPAAAPPANDQGAEPAAKPASPERAQPSSDRPTKVPAPAAHTAPSGTAAEPKPAEAPEPAFRELTIPAGTSLSVTMLTTVTSNGSKPEDRIKGSIAKPVTVSGTTALPVGTQLTGSVMQANESGRVKGRASVEFRFDHMVVNGESMRVETAAVTREAAADTKSDVKKGGLGAGAGAIVGGIIGGGKGAAIGAVAGGAGTVLATKGNEVEVPSGTVVSVLLQDPVTVTVPIK
jgi:hypothetical protein